MPTIGNTNVVNLNSSNVVISSGGTAYASGCTFSGGSAVNGGAFNVLNGGSLALTSCVVSGNSAYANGRDIYAEGGVAINDCNVYNTIVHTGAAIVISGNSNTIGVISVRNGQTGATVTISSGASINLTSSIFPFVMPDGIIVKAGGCTINNTSFGSPSSDTIYTSIVSSGGGASGTLAS